MIGLVFVEKGNKQSMSDFLGEWESIELTIKTCHDLLYRSKEKEYLKAIDEVRSHNYDFEMMIESILE